MEQQKQILLEIGPDEVMTPFLERINDFLIEEKKLRHEGEAQPMSEVCCKIIQHAFDEGEYVRMRQFMLMLVKRRGQAKKAITDMVALCMGTLIEKLPTREEKFNLLASIREACEGKMYAEREYADCTRKQVEMFEQDGKIDEAAKIIQEIQIETYGSLQAEEKVQFILYQMKLVLMRSDYVRVQILSRKISKKAIGSPGLEGEKIQYYMNMVRYWIHEKELLEVAKSYQTIFDTLNKATSDEALTAKIDPTGERRRSSFRNFVLYLLVCPYTNEKVDLLNIVEAMYPRELEQEEGVAKFVRKFLTFELMPLNEGEIEKQMLEFEPFQEQTLHHKNHMMELLRQLVQHNIRVIEKYYARVRLERLAQLVGVSVERAENEIGDMVVNKRVAAKINRLAGVVVFSQRKQFTNESLNGWNHDVKNILDKVEMTCHLINREKVIHS